MSSLNRVQLIGHLGADPEIRSFQNGGRVVNFRIATSETWKDKSGDRQERTEWTSIAVFNEPLGEIAEKYLRKGSQVYIEGQLETRKWQDRDGADRFSTEVVLRPFRGQIVLLGGRSDGGGGGGRSDDGGGERRSSGGGASGGGGGQRRGGGGWDSRKSDLDDEIPF